MHYGFYNLKDNPFRLTPDPSYLHMTSQHREALAGLVYSAFTRPGLTVLVGEAGTGKTTLINALLRAVEKQGFVTALCNNPTLTRQEFYDLLLLRFGIDSSSTLKSRQLTALQTKLVEHRSAGRRAILIVDEAQRLSPELLEEIRLLGNVETPTEKLLDIVISGQPELAETLRREELRQLKQRISRICRLAPLGVEDVTGYINHRMAMAGLAPQDVFPAEVMQLIFQYTNGIPRLVNTLCDSALQSGFALQVHKITADIITEAARDLELAKAMNPWSDRNGHHSNGVSPVEQHVNGDGKPDVSAIQQPITFTLGGYRMNPEEKTGFFANLFGRRASKL